MKKYFYMIGVALLLMATVSSCAINHRAQLDALAKCDYSIQSLDDIRLAGRSIESFQGGEGVSMSSLPAIALALLQQNLPLEAKVNLNISNPTQTRTAINEFKYIIEIGGKPLFEGEVQENIHLSTNESVTVPLTFKANIFGVAKENGFDKLLGDIFTRKSDAFLALKIKPSVKIGGKNYYYPGYITVDKDFGKGLTREIEKRL